MSSLLDSVRSLVPYHLLSYGTLLGIQFYQVSENTAAPILVDLSQSDPVREELHKYKVMLSFSAARTVQTASNSHFPGIL
jgi:hypothetical protein